MSNNKPIIIFIALAATLFGAAVVWKIFKQPEEQVAIVEAPEIEAPQPQEEDTFEIIEVSPELQPAEKNVPVLTEEERKRRHAASAKSMKFSMKYQTPESVIKAIEAYERAGNQDMVNQLINYLTDSFPDYEIPANFGQ